MPKRHTKQPDGKYHVDGKTFDSLVGSRAQVYHGTVYKTTGGLTKKDLFQNKHGRIVSASKHVTASRLQRHDQSEDARRQAHLVLRASQHGQLANQVWYWRSGARRHIGFRSVASVYKLLWRRRRV